MTDSDTYLTCPFCQNLCVAAQPGITRCPDCDASFEIDDCGECIFADTDDLKLPKNGTACAICGLIQAGDQLNCLYCGVGINTTVQ